MSTWSRRLRNGMTRSRTQFAGGLGGIFRRDATWLEPAEALEALLLAADIGPRAAAEISGAATAHVDRDNPDASLRDAVRRELLGRLRGCERPLTLRSDGAPTVILVTGVNGAGKTTTIAKLAAGVRSTDSELPLTFAAADTFRAAAVDQLAVWAERVGATLIRQQEGSDPAAVVYDAVAHAERVGGVVLIDTAGRLQTRHNLMAELQKIGRTVEKRLGRPADERLLVLDATTGQNGVSQAERFHEAVDLTGVVLTKLDGTSRGGVVVSMWERLRVPLMYIGVGEGPEDMQPFSPEEFVDALLVE